MFYFFRTTVDPDLWGHLQFGKDIYEQKSIPEFDTYSYSAHGASSINHEWLAELIFHSIFSNVSYFGLILFKFIVAFVLSLIIYRQIHNEIQSRLLVVFVFVVTVSAVSYGFAIRTQIFTYLLFPVVLIALKRDQNDPDGNVWLFALPPIFAVWCNLHGGFVAALAIMIVYMTVKLVSRRFFDRKLFYVILLCFLASLINPYGMDLWKFLLRSMTQTPLIFIDEWNKVKLSPNFISYFILLAVAIFVLIKEKLTLFEYVLIIAAACYSFIINRHTVLFSLIFAIFLPKYIERIFGATYLRIEQRLSNRFLAISCASCSLFFVWGTFFNLPTNSLKILVPSKEYPVDAVEFLKANNIAGNIFPWFDWGEMCIGELSPRSKVFFDGRFGIVYDDQFIKDYFEIIKGNIDYRTYLEKYPETDIFLLNNSNPIMKSLSNDGRYERVFSSGLASVFLKKNERNKEVLEKFNQHGLIFPNLKEPFYFEKMPR